MGSRSVRFTARERRVLAAVAATLLPSGGVPAPGASDLGTAEAVARLVETRLVTDVGWIVKVVLWALELWTVPRYGRRFSRLPAPQRSAALTAASTGRWAVRAAQVELMKHLIVNTYLSDARVAAETGYRREEVLEACRARAPLPPPHELEVMTWPDVPDTIDCDVVVVGSGAGGAPVAAILAEAGLDVVVVEEGPYRTREYFEREPLWHRFLDLYRDGGLTGTLGRPPIPVPLGRAVGGTTVVNAGTCFRAPDDVLRRWGDQLGLEELTADELAPLFAEVEDVQSVCVPAPEVLGTNAEIFRRGALQMCGDEGAPLARNARSCRGCGESVVGCPFEAKQGVQLTWLPRAQRAGARILARVRVRRVTHEGGRATGVEADVLHPGSQDFVRGRTSLRARTVVVSAGAFHTPVLLQRSGVPDASGRRGHNLQIHPAIGIVAEMPYEVRGWEGVLQSWGVDTLMAEHGIMIEATASPPPLTGGQLPFLGNELKELIASGTRMATTGFLIEDSTSGRVRPGPRGRAIGSYDLTDHDEERIAIGFAWCAEAFLEAGARRVLVGRPGQRWATNREDIRRIRSDGVPSAVLKLSAYHPVGTHRLSATPRGGPSDPWGAVRGMDGLWVSDASLLPSCIGVNPQITIMTLALRVARRILELR